MGWGSGEWGGELSYKSQTFAAHDEPLRRHQNPLYWFIAGPRYDMRTLALALPGEATSGNLDLISLGCAYV